MSTAAGAPPAVTVSPQTGLVTFLSSSTGIPLPVQSAGPVSATSRAEAFLDAYGAAFGLGGSTRAFLLRSTGPDEAGMEHVRVTQTHRGVPVSGGELTVHLKGHSVVAVNARTLANPEGVNTEPSLPAGMAARYARRNIARRPGSGNAHLSPPRLELFNRGLLEGRPYPTRLAWFIEATDFALREYIWIDAVTGATLLQFSQLAHSLTRQVYDAEDGSVLPGVSVRSEGEGVTNDPDVDQAYDYSGDTYDYFLNEHGRDSYDDAGAPIVSSVHYCPSTLSCPYANAFWNGTQMVYGEDYPDADDVAAHELTHAVIEHTANLFYYMQSGALSESYADVFGETVDQLNMSGTDTPDVFWQLGEDRPGGVSRHMMSPNLHGQPAKVSDWQFECDDPGGDRGGVHTNSGVPNHAYALAVDGGTYNDLTIQGIGLTKAGKIWYRTLNHYLLSASDLLDHDLGTRQACQDLIGVGTTDVISAADCAELDKALDAVEMDQPWPCSPVQPATAPLLCPSSEISSTLFFDDMESATSNWDTDTTVPANLWVFGSSFATSGIWSLWGADFDTETDSSVQMTVDVTVPAGGAFLQFDHSYGFENYTTDDFADYYDGGVVEVSTDSGGSWSDAGGMISAGAAYSGKMDSCCDNPLGGRSGFVGDSWGYTASQLDLSSLAGQDVRFRFRIGTDYSNDDFDYGWFVDDVRAYECPASCLAMPSSGCLTCEPGGVILSSGGGVEEVRTWIACTSITAGTDFGAGADGVVTLIAPQVVLEDGFFVEAGGELTVIAD